jgi:ABC-type uncharacterized transport system involved in gliding motility auxiliary subunit
VIGILRSFKPANERFTMAARITGPIATAYPDGPPPDKPASDTAASDKAVPDRPAEPPKPDPNEVREGKLDAVVVADTDMLEDRLWAQVDDFFGQRSVTPTASNADFVMNSAESLIGGGLIGLRSRGTLSRPFEVVDDMQRDAESRYRTQEQELRDSLKSTQTKLASLRRKEGGPATLTAEQQKEIDDFSGKLIDTRRQLRKVQLALRENIDRLKAELVFINAGLVPILVALVAVVLGLLRYNRRRRAAAN